MISGIISGGLLRWISVERYILGLRRHTLRLCFGTLVRSDLFSLEFDLAMIYACGVLRNKTVFLYFWQIAEFDRF